MYKNLKTNLPKEVMAFPDYDFKNNLPSFVKHEQVLEYLEDYANNFDLMKNIKFETTVTAIEPFKVDRRESPAGQDHRWRVTSAPVADRANTETSEFDAVMICAGHY